jgi:SAM-dependent methyltransferase
MKTDDIPLNRLYGDLSFLWPLVSAPEEYAEEAAHWRTVLHEKLGPGRHHILELGVGGGHNLSHLTAHFEAVAVDISERMLEHSRRLNPDVEHIPGDMRSIRLDRKFDAVLIHDAISYMLTEEDLRATFATAAAHLHPGDVFITGPDYYRETFRDPHIDRCTRTAGDTTLTYVEYVWDPDPDDTTTETIMTYFIREHSGLRIEHDRHITGLFPISTWERLISEAGFAFEKRTFSLKGDNAEYILLTGVKGNSE